MKFLQIKIAPPLDCSVKVVEEKLRFSSPLDCSVKVVEEKLRFSSNKTASIIRCIHIYIVSNLECDTYLYMYSFSSCFHHTSEHSEEEEASILNMSLLVDRIPFSHLRSITRFRYRFSSDNIGDISDPLPNLPIFNVSLSDLNV